MFGISFKSKPAVHYDVGVEVEANYNNKGKWMEGTIIRVRDDSTFDIEFKNGRKENSVPSKRIKPMNHSAYQSGVASPQIHGVEHHSDHDDDNVSVSSVHSSSHEHHHKPTKRGSMSDYFHAFSHSNDNHHPSPSPPIDKLLEVFQPTGDAPPILEALEEVNEPEPEVSVKIRKKLNKTGMKQRIKKFRESKNGSLDISELDLAEIPVGLFNAFFDSIKILNVSRNCLTSLSNTGYFVHLTHIDLSHNSLSDLAGLNLYSLKSLRTVNLSWNKLTEISGELTSLAQVETLLLAHNSITTLPCQEHFSVMKGLVKLDLSHNKIFSVTDELELLPRLDDLNLAHNVSEFFRRGTVVSIETVFEESKVGDRTKKLLEKKSLYASKEARRSLVKNALEVHRRVVIKEQEVRYNELQAAAAARSAKYANFDGASVGGGSSAASVSSSEM